MIIKSYEDKLNKASIQEDACTHTEDVIKLFKRQKSMTNSLQSDIFLGHHYNTALIAKRSLSSEEKALVSQIASCLSETEEQPSLKLENLVVTIDKEKISAYLPNIAIKYYKNIFGKMVDETGISTSFSNNEIIYYKDESGIEPYKIILDKARNLLDHKEVAQLKSTFIEASKYIVSSTVQSLTKAYLKHNMFDHAFCVAKVTALADTQEIVEFFNRYSALTILDVFKNIVKKELFDQIPNYLNQMQTPYPLGVKKAVCTLLEKTDNSPPEIREIAVNILKEISEDLAKLSSEQNRLVNFLEEHALEADTSEVELTDESDTSSNSSDESDNPYEYRDLEKDPLKLLRPSSPGSSRVFIKGSIFE